MVFLVFVKGLSPRSRAKTAISKDHLQLEECMPGIFASGYLGRNGCQADYEKLKITSKQKTINNILSGA